MAIVYLSVLTEPLSVFADIPIHSWLFLSRNAFFLPRRDGIFPLHIYSGLFVRRFFCRLMVSSSRASGVCLLSPRQPARVCTVWRSYRYRKANGLSGSRAERNRAQTIFPGNARRSGRRDIPDSRKRERAKMLPDMSTGSFPHALSEIMKLRLPRPVRV